MLDELISFEVVIQEFIRKIVRCDVLVKDELKILTQKAESLDKRCRESEHNLRNWTNELLDGLLKDWDNSVPEISEIVNALLAVRVEA